MQKLLTTKELAESLGIACSTLIQYRKDGTGPIYIKLGHLVRYKKEDNFTQTNKKRCLAGTKHLFFILPFPMLSEPELPLELKHYGLFQSTATHHAFYLMP